MVDNGMENRDIVALAADWKDAIVQIFFVREGKLIGRDHFHVRVAEGDSEEQILSDFLKQFYSGTPFLPEGNFRPAGIKRSTSDRGVAEYESRS